MSDVEVEHLVTFPADEPLIRLPMFVTDGSPPRMIAVRRSAVDVVLPAWLGKGDASDPNSKPSGSQIRLRGVGHTFVLGLSYDEALDLFAPEES